MTTATEEKKKIRREIQPKDGQGNPIGSPHVYEGETEQEVMDKMAAAIANGTAKIRSLSEEKEKFADLLTAPATAPEGAEMAEPIPPVKRRDLTPEEKLEISNMLRDPARVQDAYAKLYEAETGRKPVDDARANQKREEAAEVARVKAEAELFMQAHPEFYSTKRNGDLMGNYLAKRGMKISFKNFEIAFRELDKSGLLETFPEAPPEPPPAPRTEAAEPPPAAPTTAFPSSIRASQSSGSGPSAAPKSKLPSAEEFATMKPDAKRDLLKAHGLWGAAVIPAGIDIANPRTWTKLRHAD